MHIKSNWRKHEIHICDSARWKGMGAGATTFLKVHIEINGRKQETNKAIRSNLTPVMSLKYTSWHHDECLCGGSEGAGKMGGDNNHGLIGTDIQTRDTSSKGLGGGGGGG